MKQLEDTKLITHHLQQQLKAPTNRVQFIEDTLTRSADRKEVQQSGRLSSQVVGSM